MVDIQTSTNLKCYHCGDICNNSPLLLNTKAFCCVGCKTVYELLGENFLCNYYSLTDTPGNKIPEVEKDGYAYLDDDLINNSLLNFQDGGISGVTFYIPNIHCSSCIWLLENLYKIHAGIVHSSIQFQKKEIDIQFNSSISLRELTQLLAAIGYAPSITLEGKKVSNKNIDRALYYKLGIAGFCFGNIMMLSLPEYLSVIDEFTGEIKNLFSIFSFLLAIPVFFYCASDYFISSLKAIKNKVINIDLPIALGLLAAFTQSTYELISGNGPGYFDSLTGLIFFLLIGKWYQKKTYEALSFDRDYKSYFPLAVNKIDGEEEKYVQLGILKIGDVISIRNNELIPADGLIIEGDANIDYSFVTGESLPVSKKPGELIFAGGRQQGPIIKIQLKKIVSESYLTQLWNKDNSKQKTTGLVDFTNKIGKYFTIGVLIISIGTYFYWLDKDSTKALYSAVSVLIIFCPCTLALAIPFCFGYAKNILGINGLFLKNTDTIEKIASNHAIVFDKTGTITYTEGSDVEYTGNLTPEDKVWVKSLVKNSTHPLCNIVSKYLTGIRVLIPDYFEEVISQGIKASFGNNSIKIAPKRKKQSKI